MWCGCYVCNCYVCICSAITSIIIAVLGAILASNNNLHEAISHYEKSIKINSNYGQAYNNLGTAFHKLNKMDEAILNYEVLKSSDNYFLLKVELETGRHHQIRCQLSKIGCPIKGDVKYGARRANRDLSIHLHARELTFSHPTTKESIKTTAPCPDDNLWRFFEKS